MGLTSWKKSPLGKVHLSDVVIAKNYLSKHELDHLNRIVSLYLDHAELQAIRQIPMYMADWVAKLNSFLKFNQYEILTTSGNISHEVAESQAMSEYEKFRIKQDKSYISDFDKFLSLSAKTPKFPKSPK